MHDRRHPGQPDRRALDRAVYRRAAPALLELEGCRCAVRDLGPGGLRVEPAPAGRVWHLGDRVTGTLVLRGGERIEVSGTIGRIDHTGLALIRNGDRWPQTPAIDSERTVLTQRRRERRAALRLHIPTRSPGAQSTGTPLRDVSAGGLRYILTANESAPAVGSRIEGALRIDAETAIQVCGRVVRHVGREIAVAFDPPGLDQAVLARLRKRFLGTVG